MMIQPMTYFDLAGVPMFSGAYLITEVKHNFKPNNASTTFKGVRQPRATVPIVTDVALAMNISFKGTKKGSGKSINSIPGSGGGIPKGGLAPIVRTIVENGGLNGNVEQGFITTKVIPNIVGVDNKKSTTPIENVLISEAVDTLVPMLTDWVNWMKDPVNGFVGINNNYTYITSVFRDYEKQVQIREEFPTKSASPGSSPHGWGIAVDLQFLKKDGSGIISNKENTKSSFNIEQNPSLKWLLDNSYTYGWVPPYLLRDGSPLDEHWHFEYHGTAAICLINKNPTTYGYTTQVTQQQKSFVKNPKGKDGNEAKYTGCEYTTVRDVGDGNEEIPTSPIDTKGFNQDSIKTAVKFFMDKNFSTIATSAIVGSLLQESQLIPTIVNINPKLVYNESLQTYAAGIAQWIGPRRVNLLKYAKSTGLNIPKYDAAILVSNNDTKTQQSGTDIKSAFSVMTLDVELNFLYNEIQTYKNFDSFKNSTNLADAISWIYTVYEGGNFTKGADVGKRGNYAGFISNNIKNNEFIA